jgi:hypothetical protein
VHHDLKHSGVLATVGEDGVRDSIEEAVDALTTKP